ncbi:MAG TPA: phosphatidylserine/phosphatidylglycerophosphate/cardiolipin synthase family protein [Gaiellales bacterium]|nr:phosphatidylserine/phosphatidylglycerophosphate/cardiolipin synthase family protein [Gaiellales bacterium]
MSRSTEAPGWGFRTERAMGDWVTAAVQAKHRRRLNRLGNRALAAPPGGWAEDAPPPRPGNDVTVLIDGDEALGAMVEEIRGARSHVHATGWFMSPDFVLQDSDEPVVLRNLLAEAAARVDVRVLLWAGAPVPVFRPSRRAARRVRDELRRAGPIRCALDAHERPLHCHHEKTIVVDGRVAFVGGIDLTSLGGDRRDTPAHLPRARLGWHDAAARLEGPAVGDVARHFALRWATVTGEDVPVADPQGSSGSSTVQFIRTIPEHIYAPCEAGSFGILESYVRTLSAARRLVYIESQYLWSPEIVDVLAEKLRRPPDDRFRLVLVLPRKPKGGGDDTRGALAELIEADGGAGRVLACCLNACSAHVADPIYVHAKLAVVDDTRLILGSANLNDHSLLNDTEACIVTDDADLARSTRLRLWAEHLQRSPEGVAGDPTELVDRVWRPIAEEQLERRSAGLPLTHRLMRLDHVSRRSDRLLGPLQGLLVDG